MKSKESKESIGNLTPSPYNPRNITDKQLAMLKKSMAEFGEITENAQEVNP